MWTHATDLSKSRKSRSKVFILMCFLLMSLSFGVNAQDEQLVTYPILMLDFGQSNAANATEPNWTGFTIGDIGSTIEGITITVEPNDDPAFPNTAAATLNTRDRNTPTGFVSALMYDDFWFTFNGGIKITLEGLDPDTSYAVSVYSFDASSGAGGDRISDWFDGNNDQYMMTSHFAAGSPPTTQADYESTGLAQTDSTGTLRMYCDPNQDTAQLDGSANPYAFLNGLILSSLTPLTTARKPIPAPGDIVTATAVELQWTPGQTAVSSNVYLGDDLDAVTNATTETQDIYLGNTGGAAFSVGSAGNPYPDGLIPFVTYYWRIDSVEGDGTVHKGDVWSFIVPPKEAFLEVPVDTSLFNDPNLVLSWGPGAGATEHHLYFGDNMADVQAGTGGTTRGVLSEPNFVIPGLLENDKTYYWRVDEYDGTETHTGPVWSFTTSPEGLGMVDVLIWEGIAGAALTDLTNNGAYPDSPTPPENRTILPSPTLPSFDTGDSPGNTYGGQIEGWLFVPLTGEYTFFFSCSEEGELLLSSNDDSGQAVRIAYESTRGSYNSLVHSSVPILLEGGSKYYIMARWKADALWDHCQVGWQGPGIRTMQIIQGNYLAPYDPVQAYRPVPDDGAVNVAQLPILRWQPGNQAQSHNVYMGTDPNALTQVVTNQIGNEEYVIATPLDPNQTYSWRVDEINNANSDSPWVGKTWSFTTASFWVVDDFEYYKTSSVPGDRRIFEAWRDQYPFTNAGGGNTPGNGTTMIVGTDAAPFGPDLTIVNTGSRQSLPLTFDNLNDPFYAETDRTFASPQDWSQVGGQPSESLGIAVYGRPASPGDVNIVGDTYTVTGSGEGIPENAQNILNVDEFHYVYQALNGDGSMTVRVDSIEDTGDFARAGIMIRNGLGENAINAGVYVAPSNRVLFQYREFEGEDRVEEDTGADSITVPYWLRITRSGAVITGEMSADGVTWNQINDASEVVIAMFGDVYIGLAVTANVTMTDDTDGTSCTAVFSSVSGAAPTEELDIGLETNDPAVLYVTLESGSGSATVENDLGTDAILTNGWVEWVIPLSDLTAQGLDLTDVRKMIIGIGDKQPNGAGKPSKVWIDDIRIY